MDARIGWGCGLILLVAISAVQAHDLGSLGHNSIKLSKELNLTILDARAEQEVDPEARSVYSRLLLWAPGQSVLACFYDGDSRERGLVVKSAEKLLGGKNVNISFDFGAAPQYRSCSAAARRSDVRVSFSEGCCAAYLGTVSHLPRVNAGPSVFLQGILNYPPDNAQQTVMHELMHALGFNHEHQSPRSVCEREFKKDVVMAAYKWTEAEYITNLKQLDENSESYTWSTNYDPKSIMKYYFPASFLKNGTSSPCYSQDNLLPSAGDYEGLRRAYPKAGSSVPKEKARGVIDSIANSNDPMLKALASELAKMDR